MILESALSGAPGRKQVQHEAVGQTETETAVSGIMNDVTTFAGTRGLPQVRVTSPKPGFLHVTRGPVTLGILVHGADKFDASAPNSSFRIGISRQEVDDMLIAFLMPQAVLGA